MCQRNVREINSLGQGIARELQDVSGDNEIWETYGIM